MPSDLTRELVTDLRAWYEDNDMSQKDLARTLNLSPQQLAEIFARRNQPTGEQVLKIQEFLRRNNMKTDYLDPRATPRPTAGDPGRPPRPRTLSQAIDALDEANFTISNLRSELAQAKAGAVASPSVKPVSSPATPGQIRAAAPTRQGIVADRTADQKLPEKLVLPATATTPFLAGEIIKVTTTESLRRMLDSETIPWRKSCLYKEIKAREQLSTY